jgi:hypothetical protein
MTLETGKPESVTEIIQQNIAEEEANKAADAAATVQQDQADLDDPDSRELAEARAALAREQGSEGTGEPNVEPQPKPADAPEKGATPDPANPQGAEAAPEAAQPESPKPGKGEKVVPVPVSKLREMKDQSAEAIRVAAYWKGKHDAVAASAVPAKAESVPEQALTPEQQIQAVRSQALDLAEKLDNGEITNRKYVEERQKLEDAEAAIRQAMAKPAPAEPAPAQSGNDLYLEEKTAQLESRFKYTSLITSEAHWDFLAREAANQLRAEGIVFAKGALPPAQALQLRTRISELTDVYGPIWTGKPSEEVYGKAATASAAPAQPVPAASQPALSKQAQARADKLAMAREEPPNLAAIGQSGNIAGEPSPQAIEAMSDEEIAALPQATRDRLLGRLPSS